MAEALKTFREGEDILASETNENNQFLLSKLTDNAAQVQAYVEGEVATIKSNVSSVQATLQNNIDDINELLNSTIENLFAAIMPNYANGSVVPNGSSYTIPSFGWIVFNTVADNKTVTFTINGNTFNSIRESGDSSVDQCTTLPVSKGDVVVINGLRKGMFYPCKGFEVEVE